jgi:predicted aspartyl protease
MLALMAHVRASAIVGLLAGLPALMLGAGEACATATETSGVFALAPDSNIADQLQDVLVEAPEPKYVSPTIRDHIGRIWAPVMINGKGPFRMVLDTGASHSAVTALVALSLGISTDQSATVLLKGVTGSATVQTIHVDTLSVGDLDMVGTVLPIVPDALGGAEGILGYEGLSNKRIFIDFRRDRIVITYSRDERAADGYIRVPFKSLRGQLIAIDTMIGGIRTKAIIDTGGQTTIANLALRDALARRSGIFSGKPDTIVGATKAVQSGEIIPMPPIKFGSIQIDDSGVTFADMYIFKEWKLTQDPAIMIGMDALGLFDALVIDYRRHELQIRTRGSG